LNRLLVVGFLLVVVGVAMAGAGSAEEGNVSTGGFVIIGPVPIVFGTGSDGGRSALLSAVLGGLMLAIMLLMALRFRDLSSKGNREIDK